MMMESIVEAAIILLICIVGIISNTVSAAVLTHNRVFRNPFGMLTTVHTIANIGVLFIFTLWFSPTKLTVLNNRLGQLSLFFAEVAFHACLFISLNRLAAISSPSFYRNRFTVRLTAFLIIIILLVSFSYWITYFFPGCDFYFNAMTSVWAFANTDCGDFMATNIDLRYNVSVFALVGIIDLTTLLLLRRANTKLGASSEITRRRNIREVRFFLQAFTNTLVYAFMLICFHIVSYKVTSSFAIFLTTTGVWGFSHSCGGVILVVFNKEIWRVFRNPTRFWSYMLDSKTTTNVATISAKRSEIVSTF